MVVDLAPDAGEVSVDPDGAKVVTVETATTVRFTPQIAETPEPITGYQLNFASCDITPGQLALDDWTTASAWPMKTDAKLNSPEDTFVAAAMLEEVTAPPSIELGTFLVVAPVAPGDYLISLDSEQSGAFRTGFVGVSGVIPVEDFGDVILRVRDDLDRHPGDANLDGVTDVRDFNIWNAHKFTSGTDWTRGDFDLNGETDVRDFNIWNAHKFTSAPAPPSVDAVLQKTATEEAMSGAGSLARLTWLCELEGIKTVGPSTDNGSPVHAVIDKLLASFWQ